MPTIYNPASLYEWRFTRFTGTDADAQDLSWLNGQMPSSGAKKICEENACCADAYNTDGRLIGSFVDLSGGVIVWVPSQEVKS
jgi:hypothetical protein